jgi:hypothetical protein
MASYACLLVNVSSASGCSKILVVTAGTFIYPAHLPCQPSCHVLVLAVYKVDFCKFKQYNFLRYLFREPLLRGKAQYH